MVGSDLGLAGGEKTPTPHVLVVGYNAFDVTVPLSEKVVPDTKHEVPFIRLGGGGPGATAAVTLARLGARVTLVTPLTDDLPGRQQRRELEEVGIDLGRCPILEGHQSPLAVIMVDAATQQRTIFWSRGRLPRLDPELIQPDWLDGVDLLYHDGHEPQLVAQLARDARQRGLPVVMDAGSVRTGSADLVELSTDVIGSRFFGAELTGHAEPEMVLPAMARMGPGRVGLTFGEHGLLALVQEQVQALPAFDLPVLDTTGAGDVFHAGYAFALARGLPFRECLRFGSAAAVLKCRGWGGRSGLPSLREVEAVLGSAPLKPLGPPLDRFPTMS
jgi:sulfofructose kinase